MMKKLPDWAILILNLLAMVLVGFILVKVTMSGLRSYTKNGKAFRMPDIIELTPEEAEEVLSKYDLSLEVVETVPLKDGETPGILVKSTPKAGSMIKSNRKVFATMTDTVIKRIIFPEISFEEVPGEQALSDLENAGFVNVQIRYVAGVYDQLAQRVKTADGRIVHAGDELPYNEQLFLEVSSTGVEDDREVSGVEVPYEPEEIEVFDDWDDPVVEDDDGEDWF